MATLARRGTQSTTGSKVTKSEKLMALLGKEARLVWKRTGRDIYYKGTLETHELLGYKVGVHLFSFRMVICIIDDQIHLRKRRRRW